MISDGIGVTPAPYIIVGSASVEIFSQVWEHFAVKMMDFAVKMMDFALKTMNFESSSPRSSSNTKFIICLTKSIIWSAKFIISTGSGAHPWVDTMWFQQVLEHILEETLEAKEQVAISNKNDEFCSKSDGFCIINGGFCIRNDGFCIQNDGFEYKCPGWWSAWEASRSGNYSAVISNISARKSEISDRFRTEFGPVFDWIWSYLWLRWSGCRTGGRGR